MNLRKIGYFLSALFLRDASNTKDELPNENDHGRDNFERFLLAEYDHISQAYFATVASISQFFQYYVLIISLPVSAAVVFGKVDTWVQYRKQILGSLRNNDLVIALVTTVIFLALWAVAGYVTNLRADSLLYARTINGIRKYFSNYSGLPLKDEFRYRILPRSTSFPAYFEPWYFGYVVITFALLNSLILFFGWWVYAEVNDLSNWLAIVIGILGVALHLGMYRWISSYREYGYLNGHIIGVDIDGVIAKHRQQFAKILKVKMNIDIDPDKITQIPVREDDEISVFHNPKYWTEMPVDADAVDAIRRLRDIL